MTTMDTDFSRRDRFRGALVGLAVGDALGTSVEFKPPGTFPPVTDMVGGGPFGLPPGAWTDDTSMALCLADSLLARRGFDPVDQLERYRCWYRDGERSSCGRPVRGRRSGRWWTQMPATTFASRPVGCLAGSVGRTARPAI